MSTNIDNIRLDKESDFILLSDEGDYSGFSLFERNLTKDSLENLLTLLDQISAHYDDIIEVSQPCWADSSAKFDVLKSKLTLQERTVFCALIVWDEKKIHSIIYIDPCINRENVLSQIIDAFDIGDYVVEYDDHYHCKNCVGDLFN